MSATPVTNSFLPSRTLNVASVRSLTYASIALADLVAFVAAGLLAVWLRYKFSGHFNYFGFAPSLAIFFAVFGIAGLYPGIALNPIDEFRRIVRSATLGFLLLIGATFFLGEGLRASRIVFLVSWVLTLVFVPVLRHLVRSWCAQQAWWGIPTVIFGKQKDANMTLDMLQRDPSLGLKPIAILYDGVYDNQSDANVGSGAEQVFLGDLSHSAMFARDYSTCYAILAMPLSGSERLAKILTEHVRQYHRVMLIPDMFGVNSLSVTAKDLCGILVLEVNQQLTRFFPRKIKRALDLTICGIAAIPISPLILFLYLAVRLSSDGPGFYGQSRIGRGGKEFKVWKFRSMVPNADAILERHLEADPAMRAEWAVDHKLRRDPRVTKIGRLMRKTSLDELPQLWNVICGEMSLVGPRPIVRSEVQKYGKNFRQYCQVTPGITGLWQISGRNNTTYEVRTQIDDYYVRNWSASLDLYILGRTLKAVVNSEGAY